MLRDHVDLKPHKHFVCHDEHRQIVRPHGFGENTPHHIGTWLMKKQSLATVWI